MTSTDPWLSEEGERYARQCEEQDAAELARGLERIDQMTRQELLHLLDWDTTKTNTDRLRRIARLCWISGTIDHIDMHYATRAI